MIEPNENAGDTIPNRNCQREAEVWDQWLADSAGITAAGQSSSQDTDREEFKLGKAERLDPGPEPAVGLPALSERAIETAQRLFESNDILAAV